MNSTGNYCRLFFLLVKISYLSAATDIPHARIGRYPYLNDTDCGKTRESPLFSDQCFKFHKTFDASAGSVINGRFARKGDLNFLAYLKFQFKLLATKRAKYITKFCSGVIISQQWIMTSAHCIYCDATQFNCPAYVYAYLGYESGDAIANDTGKPDARPYIVREQYGFPAYIFGYDIGRYDIGLLRLRKSIDFGDRQLVNSVCMPERDIYETGDELAMTSGWGPISPNGTNPDTGHIMGFMRIVFNSTLYQQPNWTDAELWSVITTKRFSQTGTDVCEGDSGGPLVQYVNGRAVLLGVFSGFNKFLDVLCGTTDPELNTYWARVSYYTDWIVETIVNSTTKKPY
ncbi:lectizyme-like [Oppia nitens]|uniref:lectizyme-like n=1 Tax=Oppia nitens TaxID=1686743 RepID=UPI0023DAC5CB|nr:lectizyme-like [Oppia nitens]